MELQLKIKLLISLVCSIILYGVLKWVIYLSNKEAKNLNKTKLTKLDRLKELAGK
jgi:hypothetical protein